MRIAALSLAVVCLAGCLGTTPERARIDAARVLRDSDGLTLELTQHLRLSKTMLDALANGIPLRLVYRIHGCGSDTLHVRQLRYAPLRREYQLQDAAGTTLRVYTRRSALLAALDRVALPLPGDPPAECTGRVDVALDLTTLPTPLRIPAFLHPDDWRLVSPPAPWSSRRA